jgi:hypothetical protein
MISLGFVVLGMTCLTCAREEMAGPGKPPVLQSLVPAVSDSACRVIRLQLAGPQVTYPNRTTCGTGLTLISGGSPSLVDGDNRTVRIPLRVLNRGNDPMLEPVRVIYTPGAVEVIGSGTPANVTAHVGDSVLAGGKLLWLVGTTHTIATGDSTAAKNIYIKLESPAADAKVALGVEAMAEGGFPAGAPDSTPVWFSHDTSYTNGGRGFLRGVIGVSFKAGTTPSQKNAAIASVGGAVIGGRGGDSGWDGVYYLRIADSGGGVQLQAAVDALKARSEILVATLIHPIVPFARRPDDGNSWKPADWNLLADTAIGENWALEAIRAPLAWGCETGSNLPRIWVADRGFDSLPDLASNILQAPLGGFARAPGDTNDHGTRVASVIAAVGNNGLGMTGVMWTAGLKLRTVDRITDFGEVTRMLRGVVNAGADIANISGGRRYDTLVTAQRNTDIGVQMAADIASGLGSLASSAQMPLLIVSAGDDGPTAPGPNEVDASIAGIPVLKNHFPGKVLVVAAAQTPSGGQQRPWTGVTNGGPLVDVYAPGLAVAQLDRQSNIDIVSPPSRGSSLSAALVTGVAGLLKSFDATLTPSQLRDLIVQGSTGPARNGVVDSYASLRLAAQRPGAPLCGNRVFLDAQNKVQVQRSSPTDLETIWQGTSPADSIRSLYSYHGGRRVGIYSDVGGDQILVFNSGSWSPVPWTASPLTELSGAWHSMRRTTHDGDSTVWTQRVLIPVGSRVDVSMGTNNLLTTRPLASITITHLPQSGDSQPSTRTAQYDTSGTFTGWSYGTPRLVTNYETITPSGGWADFRGVPSPVGNRVFVLVNRFT